MFSVTAVPLPAAMAGWTAGWSVDLLPAGGTDDDLLMASAYLFALSPDPMIGRTATYWGGFQQRRRAGAELFKQSCFVGFCGSQMTLFDVPEAADFFRNGREATRG